jgi:4-hydroxybenzoate polyprenyltransferase
MLEKDNLQIPLCVDLDGTILQTDLLFESIIYLLKKNFFYIFIIPFWFLKGRYYTKFKLLEYVSPTVISLPYNSEIIDFIVAEKEKGRKIVLVTATAQPLAEKVAAHLGLFDEVLASKNGINLLGTEKAKFLVAEYGFKKFDYIGDSFKDIDVWQKSNIAHIATNNESLIKAAGKIAKIGKIFNQPKENLKVFFKQIRIHQWVKNLLLFLPPLLAHKTNIDTYTSVIWGFLAFSLIASAIYVINDLADIESDRNHPAKKSRPLAAGKLKILTAFKIIPALLIIGFGLSIIALDYNFTLVLLLYSLITVYYSFRIKKVYLLDIITLSILYTIRLIAGGIITDTVLSPWLFSFTLFIFLSLGALKRYTELKGLLLDNKVKTRGRDYYVEEIPLVLNLGISSGVVSTLVFTLYINNPDVLHLYKHPIYLYFITPVVLYWILRMWFVAHRGLMLDDPIAYSMKDKVSFVVFALVVLIAFGAAI